MSFRVKKTHELLKEVGESKNTGITLASGSYMSFTPSTAGSNTCPKGSSTQGLAIRTVKSAESVRDHV
jgi:hypothetical protein